MPRQPAFGRARRRGVEQRIRQTGAISGVSSASTIGVLVGQHILAELRAEGGEALVDLGEPRFGVRREPRAVAHERDVIERQRARLLGIEAQAVARRPQRLDAREQRIVEINFAAGARQNRRDVALDRLQRVVAVGAGEIEKHRRDAIERRAAALQRLDRIVERSWRRIVGDRGDFRALFAKRRLERRREMLGLDRRKGGVAKGPVQGARRGLAELAEGSFTKSLVQMLAHRSRSNRAPRHCEGA